jgi:DNA-binding transcriptional LysR family regulator
MAIEGLGVAVIPAAIVENELAGGRLQELKTNLPIPPLTFSASWLASPEMVAIERVAELAARTAQTSGHSSASVDATPQASHADDAGYEEVKA